MLPLYSSAGEVKLGAYGHRGLWFDKFCGRWRQEGNRWTLKSEQGADDNPKEEGLQSIADGPAGEPQQIVAATRRLTAMVSATGGRFEVCRTEGRFVTGLGRPHPVENGFAWHPTLGTPYLPGSSVKGLVRAWAELSEEPKDQIARLLGSSADASAGTICFLDAIPVEPVKLEVDVLTPHYAGWSPSKPPGDWSSPVPVPFLVTAADQRFVFSIIPRGGRTSPEIAADLDLVRSWLIEALAWEGAGAKTAVGYGRFVADGSRTAKLNEKIRAQTNLRGREEALRSPAGRWRVLVEEWSEEQLLRGILYNLEKNRLGDPAERRAFAAAVAEVRGDWLVQWRRGKPNHKATKTGDKKLKQRAGLIGAALAEQ